MDPLSIIVGAVVAAAPVAHGAGVPAPIVEQVVESARTDLPALTEQLPDPQPYVDQAVAAAEELHAQLPAEVTAQIGDRLPPDVKGAIAEVQRQLPIGAQAVVPPAFLPPPTAAAPRAEPTTAGSAQFSPGALSPFVPQGVTSVPSPLLMIPRLGGSALPPAVIPGLTLQAIPAAFLPALHSAAGVCPQVGAPVLAAQLWVENGFRYGPAAPVSEAGAMGPAQFMPDTWARWGRDYSGDGVVDPLDVTDAVVSQAYLMCAIVDEVDRGKADGSLVGDTVALALAAYNAGSGALVRNPGGGDSMPSGGDYATQTRPYVAKILAAVPRFAAMLGLTDPAVVRQRDAGTVAGAALAKVGVPYVWGANGPDAFDCSGLTRFAYAVGRQIVLPRTSQEQFTAGQQITAEEILPGDLLFENFQADGPHHVAIYVGAAVMVEAPQPGQRVRVSQVRAGMVAVRY